MNETSAWNLDQQAWARGAKGHHGGPVQWWRQAVVYEIYVRSFADGNGDGVGDLAGVLSRIGHLSSLGVDAVWFSPFYPSARADGGYDVDDHRDIDPRIGTLEEFDQVVAALHACGIKVIVDIVPNHSSDRHPWFQAALSSEAGSAERQRYIFRDGSGEDGALPPSDWQSLFGGPAWTRVADGQWYLHLFTEHQPDWNWDDADVRDDYRRTLRFWADRGVDGFRVDAATAVTKDLSGPLPAWGLVRRGLSRTFGGGGADPFPEGQHPIWDRDDVQDVYTGWREIFDHYDPPRFGAAEAWVEPDRRIRYARPDGLGQALDFDLTQAPWNATAYTDVIRRNVDLARRHGSSSTWVLSNHDVVRHLTRLAQPGATTEGGLNSRALAVDDHAARRGEDRAIAATMLTLALPGSPYLYQGEELGLPEVLDISEDQLQDRLVIDEAVTTRDGCRVPLPWTTTAPFFGFSERAAHLPQPAWFGSYSAQAQSTSPTSMLTRYRSALQLRRRLRDATDELAWLDLGPGVVAFRRTNGWTSLTNFGPDPLPLPRGDLLLTSTRLDCDALPVDATAWLLTSEA